MLYPLSMLSVYTESFALFLLFNKSYSVTTMSVCLFIDSILWLCGQQLRFLSHLLGARLEILNAYSR